MECSGWTRRWDDSRLIFTSFRDAGLGFGREIENSPASHRFILTIVDCPKDWADTTLLEPDHQDPEDREQHEDFFYRAHSFDLSLLPLGVQIHLERTGRATVTLAELRAAAKHRSFIGPVRW